MSDCSPGAVTDRIALHLVRDFENLSDEAQRSILLEDPAAVSWDHTVRSWTMESHKIALNPVYAKLHPPAPYYRS